MAKKCFIIRHILIPGTNVKRDLPVKHEVACENVFRNKSGIQVIEVKGKFKVTDLPKPRHDRYYDRKIFKSMLSVQDFLREIRSKSHYREIGQTMQNIQMPFLFDF
jgi:hypothetical protein